MQAEVALGLVRNSRRNRESAKKRKCETDETRSDRVRSVELCVSESGQHLLEFQQDPKMFANPVLTSFAKWRQ